MGIRLLSLTALHSRFGSLPAPKSHSPQENHISLICNFKNKRDIPRFCIHHLLRLIIKEMSFFMLKKINHCRSWVLFEYNNFPNFLKFSWGLKNDTYAGVVAPVTSALERWRQEDRYELESSLGYLGETRPNKQTGVVELMSSYCSVISAIRFKHLWPFSSSWHSNWSWKCKKKRNRRMKNSSELKRWIR